MSYFPFHFNLKGKRLLFIGGGKVNERRIKSLLDCGAEIVLVSPKVTNELEELSRKGRIRWVKDVFKEDLLDGEFHFAFIAVDVDYEPILEALRRKGIFCEVASKGEEGDFIFPAVVRFDDVIVSISTSARDPKLTKRLKKKIDELVRSLLQ